MKPGHRAILCLGSSGESKLRAWAELWAEMACVSVLCVSTGRAILRQRSAVLLCLNLETELPWQGGRTCEMEIEGGFGLKQADGQ